MDAKNLQKFLSGEVANLYELSKFLRPDLSRESDHKTYLEIAEFMKVKPKEAFDYMMFLSDIGCLETGLVRDTDVPTKYSGGGAFFRGFTLAKSYMLELEIMKRITFSKAVGKSLNQYTDK